MISFFDRLLTAIKNYTVRLEERQEEPAIEEPVIKPVKRKRISKPRKVKK